MTSRDTTNVRDTLLEKLKKAESLTFSGVEAEYRFGVRELVVQMQKIIEGGVRMNSPKIEYTVTDDQLWMFIGEDSYPIATVEEGFAWELLAVIESAAAVRNKHDLSKCPKINKLSEALRNLEAVR